MYRQHRSFKFEGLSVKTNMLSLLGFVIQGNRSYEISGEMYFNREFSLVSGIEIEQEKMKRLSRLQREIFGQLRWYLKQDDCNCSALFAGVFFNMENTRQIVDKNFIQNTAKSYDRVSFQTGLCGGYQYIMTQHFVIDPSLELGMEFYQKTKAESANGNNSIDQEKVMSVQIKLGIGYRF